MTTFDSKFELLVVGSPIMDSLGKVSEDFIATSGGEKGGMVYLSIAEIQALKNAIGNELVETPGGSAGNTVFAATRLGMSTTFLGKIGNDEIASNYSNAYAALGGDISNFKVGSHGNGCCLSLITPDNERTMRTNLGAAVELSTDEITVETFALSKHVHLEGYLLFNPILFNHIINCLKKCRCSVSLDLASFEVVHSAKEFLTELLAESIDIVFANEDEAAAFTGIEDDYEQMALDLGKLCPTAVVKIGKSGSIICHENELYHIAANVVDNVVDTTGAGDLYAAGFIYGISRGHGVVVAAEIGTLLASEVIQYMGADIPEHCWPSIIKNIEQGINR
ncbi:MAG: adenosine kinase [Lentisphaeria bacterium]